MGVSWTEEQKKVIELRNRSLLVSAAAGSGKTAVLVQRIITMITETDSPIDIDRLLVVTFTNAAASEMRERVARAIGAALEKNPGNSNLQRQLTLVHNAQITTIDSFCLNIIRSHFHKINLDPAFRVADEGELKLLREDVCEKVLDSFYEKNDATFMRFADSYSNAKGDRQIMDMILKLHSFADSYPWPSEWLESCAAEYSARTAEDLEGKPWVQGFLVYLHKLAEDLLRQSQQLMHAVLSEDGPGMYEEAIQDDVHLFERLLKINTLKEWQEAVSGFQFTKLKSIRNFDGNPEKKEYVQAGRDLVKKQISALSKSFFSENMEVQAELLSKTEEMASILIELTQEFTEAFQAEKKRKNILDFSDIEHYALQILVDPDTKQMTETAKEYQEQFEEIMIDEYQDSNYVQETLLRAVSRTAAGKENIFMVGDVKQSIYRFRLARPELFMEKFNTFSDGESSRQKISLHKNFRSRNEVVDIVNRIFFHIMGSDIGNVEYDEDAALYQGAYLDVGNDPAFKPELILVEAGMDSQDPKEKEAYVIAQRIREMVSKQELEGIQYKDIVILLRTLGGWGESFQKVFSEEGIPLIVSSRTGYFSTLEVQTVLKMLQVIDNPCQDIPLAAVLKSEIGGLASEELAFVRSFFPSCHFFEAVSKFLAKEEWENEDTASVAEHIKHKIVLFNELLQSFRERVPYTPVHRLLEEIYEETGFRDYVSALPAGEQRRANLDMLLEKAISYESTSYHGLFHFNRYIEQLMEYNVDFGEAEIVSEQENAVRIMSIHKSKGLEFPVVFVAGLGKQFNMQDGRSNMIFHPEYGVGLKWQDSEQRIRMDTLIRKVFSLETKRENLGEELRVLYVALTRAEHKLIMTGMIKNRDGLSMQEADLQDRMEFLKRFQAKCYLDWILPAILPEEDRYLVTVWDESKSESGKERQRQSLQQQRETICRELEDYDQKLYQEIDRRLMWTYPWKAEFVPKQKISVSELKHQAMKEQELILTQEQAEIMYPQEQPVPYVPEFIRGGTESEGGALFGTAAHRLMECLDFSGLDPKMSEAGRESFLDGQLKWLLDSGKLDAVTAGLLNRKEILRFLGSGIAGRIAKSASEGRFVRERPFVMSVPACDVWPEASERETVLIQGIIDAFWEEEDGIVLLDYKTDRVGNLQELAAKYKKQLMLYANALERNYDGKKIKDILIYSFYFGEFVSLA